MILMELKKIFILVGVVMMGAGMTGCAKKTTYGAVKFMTDPPGAEVVNLKDDATLGTSPVVVTWEGEDTLNHDREAVILRFRMRQAKLFGAEFY